MAKKVCALLASEREKECEHPSGFPYSGAIPCTGVRRCRMCGTVLEDEGEDDPRPGGYVDGNDWKAEYE